MAKYRYNGIELPALPDRDVTTYPYAFIYNRNGGDYYVAFESEIPNPTTNGTFVVFNSKTVYKAVDGTWEKSSLGNTGFTMWWANTDIFNSDGSLFLQASDPVPVEPEQPEALTARDLYRKINGNPTKLTLYKKLGGKLIPLDEHTKEVKT
jgi:hypothetical protein